MLCLMWKRKFLLRRWWWRPWEGRWYRSHYYDRGWAYLPASSIFLQKFPSGWRDDYRIIDGKDISGTISGYLIANCNVLAGLAKKTGIGKANNWGVRGLPPRQRSPGIVKIISRNTMMPAAARG